MEKKKNEIVEVSFRFALEIIAYREKRLRQHKKFVIAPQLCKSREFIWTNIHEGQNAAGISVFPHKMKTATEETEYRLS